MRSSISPNSQVIAGSSSNARASDSPTFGTSDDGGEAGFRGAHGQSLPLDPPTTLPGCPSTRSPSSGAGPRRPVGSSPPPPPRPRTPPCWLPPTCCWTATPRSSRPTRRTSPPRRRRGRGAPSSTGCASPTPASQAMAGGLRQVAGLADPVGEVVDGWVRPNGLRVAAGAGAARRGGDHLREPAQRDERRRRAVPQGGQRRLPAGLGRRPSRSNIAIAAALRDGLRQGRPAATTSLVLVEDTRHEAAVEFMRLRGVDRLPHPAGRAVADRARSSSTPPCPT